MLTMRTTAVLTGLLFVALLAVPGMGDAQHAESDLDFLLAPDAIDDAAVEERAAGDAGEGAAATVTAEPYPETIELSQAQAPPPEVAEPPSRRRIEEIVVTAQKREESLQEVPIAIQAFSGEVLIDKGITDTQSLAQITPGLVYASNAGYAQAYIRGIGSDATLPTADPSVATYVDGIYYPMIQSTIQSFANIERIEILKGPQGTLFGRNTTGGAINVVTKDPGHETEYSVLLEGAEHGHWRTSLYGAVPLTDSLAVSLSGFYDRTDAWYEQTNPDGPEIIDTQNWGLRLKLAFNPGGLGIAEDFRAVLSGYILDHEGADTNVVNQFRPSLLSTLLGATPTAEPYKAGTDLPDTNYTRIEGVNLKATLSFDAMDLVSISGYQNVENYGNVDYDATPTAGAGFGAHPGLSESFSQELQLVSSGWDRLDWVVGGYYFTGSGGFVPLNFGLTAVLPAALIDPLSPIVGNILPLLLNPLPPFPVPPITIPNTPEVAADLLEFLGNTLPIEDLIAALAGSGLLDLPGNAAYLAIPLVSVVDTEAYAAFTQLTWRATDWLNLTAGIRYSDETRELVRNEIWAPRIITDPRSFDQIRGLEGSPLVARAPRSKSWDDLRHRVSVPGSRLHRQRPALRRPHRRVQVGHLECRRADRRAGAGRARGSRVLGGRLQDRPVQRQHALQCVGVLVRLQEPAVADDRADQWRCGAVGERGERGAAGHRCRAHARAARRPDADPWRQLSRNRIPRMRLQRFRRGHRRWLPR
jgi:iron complex outermembrane recepter protein